MMNALVVDKKIFVSVKGAAAIIILLRMLVLYEVQNDIGLQEAAGAPA